MKFLKFIGVAKSIAALSKDTSTKVGAIALDDNYNIISLGYNGLPRGVDDSPIDRYERPAKYLWTAHAEENLVAQAAYSGHSLKGATVIVTELFPCAACARMLIQAGVRRIIAPPVDSGRWAESNGVAKTMFEEARMEIIEL